MTKLLAGKIALVTGGSRGVGKGAALGLGEAGATVYVTGRTSEPGQSLYPGSINETAHDITRLGGKGIAVACNHSDDGQTKTLIERIIAEHGRLDIVVNNAFGLPADLMLWASGKFWEQPLSMWDEQIQVGLRSTYATSYFAAPAMIKQGGGLIVNISSSGAKVYHMNVPYGAGKAGTDKLTLDMGHELKPHNVSVVSVWPGLVGTERIIAMMGEDALKQMGSETPIFTGRAIAALAADKNVLEKSGQVWIVAELAKEYGFTDIDGTIPEAHGYLES